MFYYNMMYNTLETPYKKCIHRWMTLFIGDDHLSS